LAYKIFDYDDEIGETYRCSASTLDEMFERDDPELLAVERELSASGRYWIGGGAAPLVLIIQI
jgi:hypothetical protein